MPRPPLSYRALGAVVDSALPVVAVLSETVKTARRRRAESAERIEAWGRDNRDRARPLVWFHAPSAGEARQAEPVLRRLRTRQPGWQLAFTYTSSSAEPVAAEFPVEAHGYLPFDRPRDIARYLDALDPTALLFTKLDVWPELVLAAAERGVGLGLIAGTVRPKSGRLRWPGRVVLTPAYAALDAVAAVSGADITRLTRLGAAPDRCIALGDPRMDSVIDTISRISPDDPLLTLGDPSSTLVAGSTWPSDEQVLFAAFSEVLRHRPDARLIVVPHQPTIEHLASSESLARRLGLPKPTRLSRGQAGAALLLVDRLGALATLYGAGALAYVGGGFHHRGLHSVVEPAGWGRPVIVGPGWAQSAEAGKLLAAGGATSVKSVAELSAVWLRWLNDEAERARAGRAGRELVEAGSGAAGRLVTLVERLVTSSPRPHR